MLIRNAELEGRPGVDVRVADGRIAEIGVLVARPGEVVLEAGGGALLPGLHDHHIHLAALAARQGSVVCGPPEVLDEAGLATRLAGVPGDGWIRGILYHESVMGLPDAAALDRLVADRPLRIQHGSGRMWLFNSAGLDALLARAAPHAGLERGGSGFTGRLFDADDWLRAALGGQPPDLGAVSARLARLGVTGVTEISPGNDAAMAGHFAGEMAQGRLSQRCLLAGRLELAEAVAGPWRLGPAKLHLHEAALPDPDDAVRFVAAAHAQSRVVAVHCTTEVELVFALAAIEAAGARAGDRIEHAGIANDALIEAVARLGLAVVSQPHFIAERGDRYVRDVEPGDHAALYRLAGFARGGVVLAGGSDAPFGGDDPWAAMRAAVSRRTAGGLVIGPDEALSPEDALGLFLADPEELGRQRRIAVGGLADVCLLDRPWAAARGRLSSDDVRATMIGGVLVHQLVDEAPV